LFIKLQIYTYSKIVSILILLANTFHSHYITAISKEQRSFPTFFSHFEKLFHLDIHCAGNFAVIIMFLACYKFGNSSSKPIDGLCWFYFLNNRVGNGHISMLVRLKL